MLSENRSFKSRCSYKCSKYYSKAEEEKLVYFFFLVDFGEDENTDQFSKILSVLSTPFKTKFYPQDYSPFYD